MDKIELIEAISGLDENGRTKSTVGVFHEIWTDAGRIRRVEEWICEKPVIKIFAHLRYIQVDLEFRTEFDNDLRMVWQLLERYCVPENSADIKNDKEYPLIVLNIAPKIYHGEQFVTGINPVIHTLQPSTISGKPSVIRFVFDEKDFFFMEADGDSVRKGDHE